MRFALVIDEGMIRQFRLFLKRAAAALAVFAAMCQTASAQCPNGQCAVPQSSYAANFTPIRNLVRAEPVRRAAAHFPHPVRNFFARRAGCR